MIYLFLLSLEWVQNEGYFNIFFTPIDFKEISKVTLIFVNYELLITIIKDNFHFINVVIQFLTVTIYRVWFVKQILTLFFIPFLSIHKSTMCIPSTTIYL